MSESIPIPIKTLNLVLESHRGTKRGWLTKRWECACGDPYPCETVCDILEATSEFRRPRR